MPAMIRFEDIYETVKRHHPEADLELLRKAYIFSAVEHKGQTRASGEPYLVHPLEVAAILADMRMDPTCVAVGLLHDVLEDTLTEPGAHPGVLRRGRAPHRGGRDQDQQDPLLHLRGAPGRELPQDAAGHGGRHARHPGQAGGPAAQHAHAPVPARGAPGAHRPRDHGHLRARWPGGWAWARSRTSWRTSPSSTWSRRPTRTLARAGRGAARAGHRPSSRRSRATVAEKLKAAGLEAHRGGPHQAPLLHPPEAEAPAHRPRAGLRLRGPARGGGERARLLRGARRPPQPVAAGARAASRTSSPCRGPTATSRCTRR